MSGANMAVLAWLPQPSSVFCLLIKKFFLVVFRSSGFFFTVGNGKSLSCKQTEMDKIWFPILTLSTLLTVKRGNFDWRGNFHRSGSFVKLATVPILECLFAASALMEINNWCSGLRIYMYLRPCLHRSNLKTSYKLGISLKNWPFFKTVLTYWMVPYW